MPKQSELILVKWIPHESGESNQGIQWPSSMGIAFSAWGRRFRREGRKVFSGHRNVVYGSVVVWCSHRERGNCWFCSKGFTEGFSTSLQGNAHLLQGW